MNIATGKFPWKLAYLGLLLFFGALVAFWYFFPRPNNALGPELGFFGGAFAAWMAFLTFKSGVATSRFGNDNHRATNPGAFWTEVIFWGIWCVLSIAMALAA